MDTAPAPAPANIAVVDDDPLVALLLNRVLTKAGYGVTVYQTGEQLLDVLTTTEHAVVCLDMSLPGLNGLQVLERARVLKPALRVILFSAAADEVVQDARSAGAFAVVPKTGSWDELRATVAWARAAR